MKKILLLFAVLIFAIVSCTHKICPTYAKKHTKEKSEPSDSKRPDLIILQEFYTPGTKAYPAKQECNSTNWG